MPKTSNICLIPVNLKWTCKKSSRPSNKDPSGTRTLLIKLCFLGSHKNLLGLIHLKVTVKTDSTLCFQGICNYHASNLKYQIVKYANIWTHGIHKLNWNNEVCHYTYITLELWEDASQTRWFKMACKVTLQHVATIGKPLVHFFHKEP